MVRLNVNGKVLEVDVADDVPLLWALRDVAHLTGTTFGCGMALCGACTVHVDGEATRSCVLPVGGLGARRITTIEGIGAKRLGSAVQHVWLSCEVVQCGYCQSGQIMSATTLLAKIPSPSDSDIDAAMSGNICRCGTYPRIRHAIHAAARRSRSRQPVMSRSYFCIDGSQGRRDFLETSVLAAGSFVVGWSIPNAVGAAARPER